MFQFGDRVQYVGNPTHHNGLEGREAVVFDGKDYYGPLSRGFIHIHFDGEDYHLERTPYNSHTMRADFFQLVAPMSPFEAEVRAYIKSELQ